MESRESTLRKLRKNKQKTFRESIRRKLKLGQIECTRTYDYTVAEIHLPMEKVNGKLGKVLKPLTT